MTTAFHFQLESAPTKLERAIIRRRKDCYDWSFYGADVFGIANTSDVKTFKEALRRYLSRHKIVLYRGDNQMRTMKHWLQDASAQDVKEKAQPPSPVLVVSAGEPRVDKTKHAKVQKPPVQNLESGAVSRSSSAAWPFLCRLTRALSSAQVQDIQKWAKKNGCTEVHTDIRVIGQYLAGLTKHHSEGDFKEALRKFCSARHIERESRGWFKRITQEEYKTLVTKLPAEKPVSRKTAHVLDDLAVDRWTQSLVESYFRGGCVSSNVEIAAVTHWQRCDSDIPGACFKFRCELRNKKFPETNSFWLRDIYVYSSASALLKSYGWSSKEAAELTCREDNWSCWDNPEREHKIHTMSSKADQENI